MSIISPIGWIQPQEALYVVYGLFLRCSFSSAASEGSGRDRRNSGGKELVGKGQTEGSKRVMLLEHMRSQLS